MNINVLETLLFSLHNSAYKALNEIEETILSKDKTAIKRICEVFEPESNAFWKKQLSLNGSVFPVLNIQLFYSNLEDYTVSTIHKGKNFKCNYTFDYCQRNPDNTMPTSDLILRFYHNNIEQNFIVPLAFLFGFNEKKILSGGYYQVYTHQLYSKDAFDKIKNLRITGSQALQEEVSKQAYTYIGITKRSWQKRYQEHKNDSMKGSYLRFHKFLREDFFKIGSIDHIIDRAGLTESEAMEIEEKNVEQMSLYPFFPNGLNMIPGGTAGLKVIHQYAKRTGYKITRKLSADIFESEFIQIQNHMLRKIVDNKNQNIKNEKLAAMWAEDIQFRIQMMTSQRNRFSYHQIQAARVLHAADWNIEKIYEYLKKISDKNINIEQLENLLSGKTYATIPDIIL